MAVKVTYKSDRNNKYELLCRSTIGSAKSFADDLDGFERIFNNEIKAHPRMSVGHVHDFYELTRSDDHKEIRIWHLKANGDRDRLVALIHNA